MVAAEVYFFYRDCHLVNTTVFPEFRIGFQPHPFMNHTSVRGYTILTSLALIFLISCKGKKETIYPEHRDIVESVYASATVKAQNQYNAIAPVAGLLLSNLVKEGDTVKAGQLIAQIDNTNPALNAENARLALEQAQKNRSRTLDELDAQISTASEQHRLDSLNYFRQKELWAKNIGTKSQLETRKLAFDASGNNLRALRSRYIQTKNQLSTAIDQASNNYSITSRSSGDFNITSKINGRVYALNYEPGELVTTQKPVAVVGDAGNFVLEMTVDEVDISRILIGQKAVLTLDAYRNELYEAEIVKIYPSLDSRSQSFIVEADFTKSPGRMYPGMSAEVSIIIGEKKNVLVIPVDYLTKDGKVLTENGEIAVKTGIRNLEMVEILNGIDKTTKLIRP